MPRRKKKRTQKEDDESGKNVPKSFIFKRGKVGQYVEGLIQNLRKVMSPNSAERLKESRKNKLKDFVSVAPQIGVTHFMVINQTVVGTNLRIMRIPHGPTLTFRITEYSLMKDIAAMQKKPHSPGSEFLLPPLLVLNNFSGAEDDKKLLTAMFQNMFPPVDLQNIKLKECRRVVLFDMDKEKGSISFRHYLITAVPVGIKKPIKKLLKTQVPNLSRIEDISEYVSSQVGGGGGETSDSEAEDGPHNRVELHDKFIGRGNTEAQKSALRLKELGPRMTLELLKVEEGLGEGRVLFHSLVKKTTEEAQALVSEKARQESLKQRRRQEQEENIARKLERKEAERSRQRQQRLEKAERKGGSLQEDQQGEDIGEEEAEEEEEEMEEEMEEEEEEEKKKKGKQQRKMQHQKPGTSLQQPPWRKGKGKSSTALELATKPQGPRKGKKRKPASKQRGKPVPNLKRKKTK